ncbi:TolC family protein [Brevundimonas sp.]|uniref:TolC family protein n=1 Tax=Brevundimonas sp. TaxID=1871086 RepID=UPI0025C0D5AC|nr:TolC family protein [Brevundimonas sp.]
MTLRPSILLVLLISSTCAAAYAPASKAQISDAKTSGLQTVGPLPLTYRDAQARLLQRSDAIEASDADVRSREAQENAVRTLRLPTVEFEGQMMRYQKTLYLPLGPLADVAQDYAISDPLQFQMERDSTRPIVTATVPLYSGRPSGR